MFGKIRCQSSPLFGVMLLACLICVASAQDASALRQQIKVLFFGDSLVAGYGLSNPDRDSLPAKMQTASQRMGESTAIQVVNMGVSGDTSSGALARLPQVIAERPDIVIIVLGGNDVLRAVDPDITFNNLDVILKELERNGIYCMLAGMKAPPNLGSDYASRFNRIYTKLSQSRNIAFYPFILEGVAGNMTYNQRDGIHPNPEGVDVIVSKMYPHVEKMVDKLILAKRRAWEAESNAQKEQKRQMQKQRMKERARAKN